MNDDNIGFTDLADATIDENEAFRNYKAWVKNIRDFNFVYQHQFCDESGYTKVRSTKFLFLNDSNENMVVIREIIYGRNKRCSALIVDSKTFATKWYDDKFNGKGFDNWRHCYDKLGLVMNEYTYKKPWCEWPEDLLRKYERIIRATDRKTKYLEGWLRNKEINWTGIEPVKEPTQAHNKTEPTAQKEG
jgi:hypothetical protein